MANKLKSLLSVAKEGADLVRGPSSVVSGLRGQARKEVKKLGKLNFGLAATSAGLWGAQELVDGGARWLGEGIAGTRVENEVQRQSRLQGLMTAERMRLERINAATEANAQRIQMLDPQLAQQLVRKRLLPRGGVVFGGSPRADLLLKVSELMAQGGLSGFTAKTGRAGTTYTYSQKQSLPPDVAGGGDAIQF